MMCALISVQWFSCPRASTIRSTDNASRSIPATALVQLVLVIFHVENAA
jgi:hypothetical protein